MNKLKKMYYLFKAGYGSFSDKAFDALCKGFETDGADVGEILCKFFHRTQPSHNQLNSIYGSSQKLRRFYLNNRGSSVPLSEMEMNYLATVMEFDEGDHFPQELGSEALDKMFQSWDVWRIIAYAQDFAFPEKQELLLIDRHKFCQSNRQPSYEKVDYTFALRHYLSKCSQPVMKSPAAQKALLSCPNQEELLQLLCSHQRLDNNYLSEFTLYRLISTRNIKILQELLLKSYIAQPQMQSYLVHALPSLRWHLEISKVRHALHKLELESGKDLHVLNPMAVERPVISNWTYGEHDDEFDFVQDYALPRIRRKEASPYLCTLVVELHPDFAEDAYSCLRCMAITICGK